MALQFKEVSARPRDCVAAAGGALRSGASDLTIWNMLQAGRLYGLDISEEKSHEVDGGVLNMAMAEVPRENKCAQQPDRLPT